MTLWYLATVYSIHPDGLEEAYLQAAMALGTLTIAGYHIYSPIVHNHDLGNFPGLENFDWLAEDDYQLHKCDGLIVHQMINWKKSKGIHYEIGFMRGQQKPIVYLPYPLQNPLILKDVP